MPVNVVPRTLSSAHLKKATDVATLQTLGVFTGTGLLLSLLLAMSGWM